MSKNKTLGLLIGRFSPLHAGHRDLIRQAKQNCDILLILVGSADTARNIKTPFTYQEREKAIHEFLDFENISHVMVRPINDYKYADNTWIGVVNDIVTKMSKNNGCDSITLFGHNKKDTDYLSWFPQYRFMNIDAKYEVCSTDIREAWFKNLPQKFEKSVVDDWNYFQKEKKLFENYPFPDTLSFSCGDAILECAGHILLIQRGQAPGAGTWALPGGFKNRNETFFDCAIRELIEETNVRVPEKVLRGSVIGSKLFDSPSRGNGIPRVTMCVHIKIQPDADGKLPRANGADDAADAKWVPLQDVMNSYQLYDDHKSIISVMTKIMPLPAHIAFQ